MSARINRFYRLLRVWAESVLAGRFWWLPLVAGASFIQLAATVRALLKDRPLVLDIDAAYFQHAGWYIWRGAIPYVNIWEPSPPLSFYINGLLAFLTQGDVLLMHVMASILTSAVAVAIALLVASLTVQVTGKRFSALLAGITLYTFAGYYILPTLGYGYKYFTLFFGLLGLWLALRRRPFLSGIALAASAVVWFPAVFFVGLGVALNWQRSGIRDLFLALAGVTFMLALILLPILYWGGLEPMFKQVVVAQLYIRETRSLIVRLKMGAYLLRFTSLFVILGALGIARALARKQWHIWWVAIAGAWFAMQIMFLDFDHFPDLYMGLVFASIGLGVLLADSTSRARFIVASLLVLGVLFAPLISYQGRDGNLAEARPKTMQLENGDIVPSLQTMYWQKMMPTTCFYRASIVHQIAEKQMEEAGGACPVLGNDAVMGEQT